MNSVMERSNGNWNQRNLGNSDMEHSHQRFVGSFQSRLDRAVADFSPLYGPIQSVGPTVLSAPFQSEEVWIAVKSMSPLRAPDIRYTRVADLINPTSNEWNSALVKSIFTPSMAQQILCIPLAKTETDDMLVWRFEGNGHYTPKSGYRLLREEASMEFRGIKQSIHRISAFVLAHVAELDTVAALSLSSLPSVPSRWSPPASGIIKINFDTSFLSSTKEAFSGVVVEGDSLTVIRKLSSDSLDKSIIQPIIIDIKAKLQLFEKITFSHVGRQGNAAAHALAKIHTQFQLPRYWVKEAPQEVEQVTIADLR
ncbi:hypothetical protein V6N12_009711 [Hibiscus sabdariffa]|uniref:RNase H type-1 domain-containing protein n=1 Tax=Hibiscus sabdariffa TaxID=183260 RepID=A0ABR2AID3_9ROSI